MSEPHRAIQLQQTEEAIKYHYKPHIDGAVYDMLTSHRMLTEENAQLRKRLAAYEGEPSDDIVRSAAKYFEIESMISISEYSMKTAVISYIKAVQSNKG